MREQQKPIFTLIIRQSGQGRSMRSIALLPFLVKAERQHDVRLYITQETNSFIHPKAGEQNTPLLWRFALLLAHARKAVLFE